MKKTERRFNTTELRVKKDDGPAKITGMAIVYDKMSDDLGGFREKIRPGACTRALKKSDVRCLIDHNSSLIVGREGVNLTLKETRKGVEMQLTEPKIKSDRFNQLVADVENGLITQQSFGFTTRTDEWEEDRDNGKTTRTLVEIEEIFDVSPVTFPAYPDTTVAKRSLEQRNQDAENSANDIEDLENQATENSNFDKLEDTILIQNTEDNLKC